MRTNHVEALYRIAKLRIQTIQEEKELNRSQYLQSNFEESEIKSFGFGKRQYNPRKVKK